MFAEVRVPLLKDLPLIQNLALEGALRQSDYSTIDRVTTWKGVLDWQLTHWMRVRGGLSRAIRAPNLNELFAQPGGGFTGGVDPCWVTSQPTAAERELCIPQGVPANIIDTFLPGASQGWNALTGGNLNLEEEKADTFTAGIVLTPDVLGGLSVPVDYFEVEVEGAITQVSSQALVNACFGLLDNSSTPCQTIRRLPFSGLIDTVNAPLLNVASRNVSGVDPAVNYGLDLPAYLSLPGKDARLGLRWVSTWQFEDETQQLASLATVDCAGFYSGACSADGNRITPDFRGLLRVDWQSGPLGIAAELQLIGDLELAPNAIPNENGTISSWQYLDLTAKYDLSEEIELFLGISNALDKDPRCDGAFLVLEQ